MFQTMRHLPPAWCSAVGRATGAWFGYRIDPWADVNLRNVIDHVRPDLSVRDRMAMVRRAWGNIGRTFAEFAVLPSLEARTELVGEDILTEVFADPRAVAVIYPHLANWEVLGAVISRHPAVAGVRGITAVYATQDDPVRMAIADERRRALAVDLLPQGRRAWKHLHARLAQQYGTIFAPVDGADTVGRLFPLFGRQPDHRSAVGKLIRIASSSGARLLPVYCTRHPAARFTVTVLPPIELANGRIGPGETCEQIVGLNALFEPLVRMAIDDWYMACETDSFGPPPDPRGVPLDRVDFADVDAEHTVR